jgi:anti-sigma factor RsiW
VTNFKPDDDLAAWDAAYVLGALSLEDRRTYENYLAANPARAAELTDFAGMPGILNALSRDEAVALTDLAGAAPAGAPPSQDRPDNVALPLPRRWRSRVESWVPRCFRGHRHRCRRWRCRPCSRPHAEA